jgi:glycerol transport system ATP-binding protein
MRPPSDTAARLSVQVIISEIAGSESFIHINYRGSRWVMLQHGVHEVEPDAMIDVFLDTRHLMAFDADGRSLNAITGER